MAIHKYLFFISEEGIKTFRVSSASDYELVKFRGETIYNEGGLSDFFEWFNRIASVASDDMIDYCFLSQKPIDFPDFEYLKNKVSSWDKNEVITFCKKNLAVRNYEIIVDSESSFVCQVANVYNRDNIEKLYLKCIPNFSMQIEEKFDSGSEETSILCQYFRDMLNNL